MNLNLIRVWGGALTERPEFSKRVQIWIARMAGFLE
jgi:hypothetical protein